MTFTLDAEVAAVLEAALEKNGPPSAPPIGDVQTRRVTLNAMLEYFNNQAQPPADDVEITDHQVTAADGATLLARWYRRPSGDTGAAVLYLHGGGMIVGSVPIFDGPVSATWPGPAFRCYPCSTGWHPSIRTRYPSKTPMPG